MLAVVPWVVAAVLGLLGGFAARGTPAPAASAGPASASDATVTTGSTDAIDPVEPTASSAATPEPSTQAPASTQLDPDVELTVLLVARNAMGTAGLVGHEKDPVVDDRWPLDARLVAIEEVTAEYAVAVVHGLVLERDDAGWTGPHPSAVAVLLRTAAAPVVVGDAWPLAPPTTPSSMPELRPVDEPDPSIVAPLTDAGWVVEEVVVVETSHDALLRVVVQGTPPGAGRAAEHVLWLLDAPGGPRLVPLNATAEDEDLP